MSKYQLENDILHAILKKDKKQLCWKYVYDIYRTPFSDFMTTVYALDASELIEVRKKAFALFYTRIQYGLIKPTPTQPLFTRLLLVGGELIKRRKPVVAMPSKDAIAKAMKGISKYLESDILVLMMREKEDRAYTDIYNGYQIPFLSFIRGRFPSGIEGIDIVYTDSMMKTREKAIKQDLVIPMQSTLKTYLFTVGIYVKINFDKGNKNDFELHEEKLTEIEEGGAGEDSNMVETLTNGFKELNPEPNPKKTTHRLLGMLNVEDREWISLYYLEGYDHKEIAEVKNIKEGNARVKVFRSMDRLRKLMKEQGGAKGRT